MGGGSRLTNLWLCIHSQCRQLNSPLNDRLWTVGGSCVRQQNKQTPHIRTLNLLSVLHQC